MKYILTATLLACSALSGAAVAAEHVVKATDSMTFEPEHLDIQANDTVTWVNDSSAMHNVVSQTLPDGAESFTSPFLQNKGEQWSHTFKTVGEYEYFCQPHMFMGMTGTISVK